uniref:Uncharacterized protein n=1 Tax=Pararge aegeria TaxID=116150 RepID=S4PTP7_9NEOP
MKCKEHLPILKNKYILDDVSNVVVNNEYTFDKPRDVNVKNEYNTNKCNAGNYYSNNAAECSDTDTSTTLDTSDESMTSLESGIKTVIYESASCKDVSSLPEDEDEANKNVCTKPHSKSACVLS